MAPLLRVAAGALQHLAVQFMPLHKATAKLSYVAGSLFVGLLEEGFCTAEDSTEEAVSGEGGTFKEAEGTVSPTLPSVQSACLMSQCAPRPRQPPREQVATSLPAMENAYSQCSNHMRVCITALESWLRGLRLQGMGEGEGRKDVSDQIEDEDQLLGAQQKDQPPPDSKVHLCQQRVLSSP